MSGEDERLDNGGQQVRGPKNRREERGDRRDDQERESRQMGDRLVAERREMTDDDRMEAYKMGLYQEILPNLPALPGYHVMWHTTTNPRDSVERRQMLGYELIKPDEVPGMIKAPTLKQGDYAGVIGMREMVAMKIPLNLYQRYMRHSHHDAPNALTAEIMAQINERDDELRGQGSRLQRSKGLQRMEEETRRRPKFDQDPGDRF